MENAKSMTEELKVEWEVPASDDETCEEVDSIPTRVLLLYKQIERDGFIELETKEYRQINSSHETSEGETVYKTTDEQKHSEYSEEPSDLEPVKEKDLEKKCLTTSAFDYDEDLNSGFEQLPKRTPKSERKTRKRVGVFEDVISDIKRYRELDARGEAEINQPEGMKSCENDNESKTKQSCKQQPDISSKSETNTDIPSQSSKTETNISEAT